MGKLRKNICVEISKISLEELRTLKKKTIPQIYHVHSVRRTKVSANVLTLVNFY